MNISSQEARVIESLVEWYIGEAAVVLKEANRNAGFLGATQAAMRGLNRVAEERFRKVFFALMRDDPERVAKLTELYRSAVQERIAQIEGQRRLQLAKESPGEHTLKNYLLAMTACLEASRHESVALRSLDGSSHDAGVQFARTTWAAMRSARVFDFPVEDFVAVYRACDQYTCEKIARVPYNNGGPKPTNESSNAYYEALNEAGARVPFPEHLPFDHVYIGIGFGVQLDSHQWMPRVGREAHDRVIGAGILGYLVWPANGGMVVEILQIVEIEDNYIMPNVVCYQGIWHDAVFTLAPWIVTHLVAAINEHRTIVFQKTQRPSFEQRRAFEKESKRLKVQGMVPRPYYLVRLERKLIEDTGKRNRERLAKIARELNYRHDRRGHERCYIRRGKLPLEPKDAKKLEEAGYKIWTINEPDSNAYRQLMERGQPPKGTDEWLAILTKWIDDTVVGPEDKPYIPAIRAPRSAVEPRPTAAPGVPREV